MSNKVKTLYESQDGIEMKQWLDNKRILYVVRANIDNSPIKFGIWGVEYGGTSAFGRLLQYIIFWRMRLNGSCYNRLSKLYVIINYLNLALILILTK